MADAPIPLGPRGAPLPLVQAAPLALPREDGAGAPLSLVANPLAPQTSAQAQAQARHVASEFESVFLNQMLAPMFEGLSTDGIGGGGAGEEMFRPMLIERYAQAITHAGGIGITDQILRELTRLQASQPNPDVQTEPGNGPGR